MTLEDNALSGGTRNQQDPRQQATMRARQSEPMISLAQNDLGFDNRLQVRSVPAFELQVHDLRLESGLPQILSDGRAQSATLVVSEQPSDWYAGGPATRILSMLRQAPPGLEHATCAPLSAPFDWGSWDDSDA